MALFGGRDTEWEETKNEYRYIKQEVESCEVHIQAQLDAIKSPGLQFQYLVQEDIEQNQLSKLGLDGWELVNFASYTVGWGMGGNAALKVHLRYVFKRPVGEMNPDLEVLYGRLAELQHRRSELASTIELRGYKAE